ncbi:3'-5' exonuclease [Mucilaginibacter aquatilis]|uniref:3'-5' exonuclease n=1 Tax=Mucilaginibacter aquatilis TaxID=1517760 RepID=A0A6I4IPC6_9SPHI|nr:3'-5' exonuclease [Mucilaginibacter aquatilis]MVN89753.1 3'-5' exonuclease [Mucilaginibacter aquatilis]
MTDYLIFIDIEASGLPINWHSPYSEEGAWPSAVQVSWLIYNKDGEELKQEDHYIKNSDFIITPAAMEIHGINPGILGIKGEERVPVMQKLANDLNQYKPLVVGHFVQLDYHILSADFHRAGIENPLANLPVFCTMMATSQFIWNPMPKNLRLADLYSYLFYKSLQDQHNALSDAGATADCFFELRKRGEINDKLIESQQKFANIKNLKSKSGKLFAFIIPVIILALLILFAHYL